MLKVKLVPMTLLVPVIDNSGDHDCKMDEQRYAAIHGAVTEIQLLSGSRSTEVLHQGASQNSRTPFYEAAVFDEPAIAAAVSQSDPVIDTTVRDSEMRSTAPEMSLDEFRERPERTKTPPRPRANSWRHDK